MSADAVKTRFAPSPTGEIHLGNLRTALFNVLLARSRGGCFLLRIEDTDLERSHEIWVRALIDDLRWLGLAWQEGPDVGGEDGPYRQSQRGDLYERYYRRLEEGGRSYPCFCSDTQLRLSRKAQRAAGQAPRYAGTCAKLAPDEVRRRLDEGQLPSIRFRVPAGETLAFDDLVRGPQRFASDDIGDFIIRRSDGSPAFFFSNAIDDALMGVTHVLRGEDHLTNTPRQLMILRALGLRSPLYGHLSLLVGADGSPLSKRNGSRSVRELREQGYLPAAILNYLARLGHSCDDDAWLDLEGLAACFSLDRLGRAPARFDEPQLRYWQKLSVERLDRQAIGDWLDGSPQGPEIRRRVPAELRDDFLDCIRDNIEYPADALAWARRLFDELPPPDGDELEILRGAGGAFFLAALEKLDEDGFRAFAKAVGDRVGVKGKALFMPLRVALTGVQHGPEMARLWALLGRDRCRERLRAAARISETEDRGNSG